MRILIAQINPIIGDVKGNTQLVLKAIERGIEDRADLVLFPELALSGYPPQDFLLMPHFIRTIECELQRIIESSKGIAAVVGLPRSSCTGSEKPLYNSAAIIADGKLLGFQDKTLLPTYGVFDERRYFEPAQHLELWELGGLKVAVTICEDIWQHSNTIPYSSYRRDPVVELAVQAPDLLLNLSASPYSLGKFEKRLATCSKAAAVMHCPLILCNQVGGNDSLIFDGHSLYVDEEGKLCRYAAGFKEDYLSVDLQPKTKQDSYEYTPESELKGALILGLRDYFHKSGFSKACLGLSGGIDSALVAYLAAEALGAKNVLGVAMPSRFSSSGSTCDAKKLAGTLGIAYHEIPIESTFQSHLDMLAPYFQECSWDATEENLQARIRGMVLMAFSNKFGYITLNTGNKSELAIGYSTLYGDMCGGLGVINDLTKGQVYSLARWINRGTEIIPWETIQKSPSAELRLNQLDSDSLPPYEVLDHILESYVEEHLSPETICTRFGYSQELVSDIILRIHRNEYKRRQSPPGLRISEKAFSIGRNFPIVQGFVKSSD